MFPSGIHYTYESCSMRRTDLSIMRMSGLDEFLVEIQLALGDGMVRKVYGDRLFQFGKCSDTCA